MWKPRKIRISILKNPGKIAQSSDFRTKNRGGFSGGGGGAHPQKIFFSTRLQKVVNGMRTVCYVGYYTLLKVRIDFTDQNDSSNHG